MNIKTNSHDLSVNLRKVIPNRLKLKNTVFLCIGTDRSTGDSLAPLVGTFLREAGYRNVIGTLNEPIHALNICSAYDGIPSGKKVLAIDACLGQLSSVGLFCIGKGGIEAGAGVGKQLGYFGKYHIKGIVNVGGFMEYYVLQNTRLSLVMSMARDIVKAIQYVFPLEKESVSVG
jgi:putative sporulation protein YyaC